MIRKAVIPAAGFGKRMLPITKAQPKEMLPVFDKPVIQYVLEEAYEAGIRDILIITGKHKRTIEDHLDRGNFKTDFDDLLQEMSIYYVRQREQKGLGDAVRYAKAFVDDEPFALLLGDNITIPNCTKLLLEKFKGKTLVAVEEVEKEKISSHGVIKGFEVEEGIFRVEEMVEKPEIDKAPSNLGIIGRYILTPEIFEYLEMIKPGHGNELQLTDALNLMCKEREVYAMLYNGKRYDIGNKLDWLKANIEIALKDQEFGGVLKDWLSKIF